MENGKIYINAEIDVIEFSDSDVIATSGSKPIVPDNEGGLWGPDI